MATYKDIIGTHVRTVTADPPSPVNGQMWYNSTEQVMKGSKFNPAGAWATGGTLNTARHNYWGAATSTDALAIGGNNDSADVGNVEKYNGSTWTEVADITARRGNAGGGTSTSAITAGGGSPNVALSETWNGSAWSETADLNTARREVAGCAADSTAALIFGGKEPSSSAKNEKWNGTSWSEQADLNADIRALAGVGTSTKA